MMTAEMFIAAIAPLLKARGFNKARATWRRVQPESVAVFNVQKSPWGGGVFYLNVGVYFSALGTARAPTENACHVQWRLELDAPARLAEEAVAWFDARASLPDAARLAEDDATKGLVCKEVRGAADGR